MKVRLSKEAIYHISEALIYKFKKDIESITSSTIALNDFETIGNAIIKDVVIIKEINHHILEARKLEQK